MKLLVIGKYPLKNPKKITDAISVYTHIYRHTHTHTHHKLYVCVKNTVYIWKSTPLEKATTVVS